LIYLPKNNPTPSISIGKDAGTWVLTGSVASACGDIASVVVSHSIGGVACGFIDVDTTGEDLTIIVCTV
jgi:hypothetical protein